MMMWSELILNEKRESIEATLLFGCPNITNSDSGELSRALPGKSSSTLIVAPMATVNQADVSIPNYTIQITDHAFISYFLDVAIMVHLCVWNFADFM